MLLWEVEPTFESLTLSHNGMIVKSVSLYRPLLSRQDADFLAKVFLLFPGNFCVLGAKDTSALDVLSSIRDKIDCGVKYYNAEPQVVDFVNKMDKFDHVEEQKPSKDDFIVECASAGAVDKKISELTAGGAKNWLIVAQNIDTNNKNVVYTRFTRPDIAKIAFITSDNVKRVCDGKDILGIYKVKQQQATPCGLPTFKNTDNIGYGSEIKIVETTERHGLYYRDLFAHKLGSTKAQNYFLVLVDNKVFGVFGTDMRSVRVLKDNYYFEMFGFTAHCVRYPRSHRLLMMLITSREFRPILKLCQKANRFYKLEGMKTVCLSKYRSTKLNNGICRVEGREKMKNGLYKIHYIAEFRQDTFKDCVKRFLDEEKEFMNGKE